MPSKKKQKQNKKKGRTKAKNGGGNGGAPPARNVTLAERSSSNPPEAHHVPPNRSPSSPLSRSKQNVDRRPSEPWKPGGRQMTRRVEQDKRLYQEAMSRAILSSSQPDCLSQPPTVRGESHFIVLDEGTHLAIISPNGAALTQDEIMSNLQHIETVCKANYIVGRYGAQWAVQSEKITGCRVTGNPRAAQKRIAATKAHLSDIENKCRSANPGASYAPSQCYKPVLIFKWQIVAHEKLVEDYKELKQPEEAVKHATEVLALYALISGSDASKGYMASVLSLLMIAERGLLQVLLRRLDQSAANMRVASALLRLFPSNESIVNLELPTPFFLEFMSVQRFSRPYFSEIERKKIEKELGIGMYSKLRYRCGGCSKEPSDSLRLYRCGGCKNFWCCSSSCLEKAWHGGHKYECQPESDELSLPYLLRPESEATFCSIATSTGPHIIDFDKETRRFFSCLTNQNIIFADGQK